MHLVADASLGMDSAVPRCRVNISTTTKNRFSALKKFSVFSQIKNKVQ
jgi:hypothetical protein